MFPARIYAMLEFRLNCCSNFNPFLCKNAQKSENTMFWRAFCGQHKWQELKFCATAESAITKMSKFPIENGLREYNCMSSFQVVNAEISPIVTFNEHLQISLTSKEEDFQSVQNSKQKCYTEHCSPPLIGWFSIDCIEDFISQSNCNLNRRQIGSDNQKATVDVQWLI